MELYQSLPFGWEPDADGFRGHVFATDDNSTVVVSIKGTSAGVFGGGGPTVRKDKINDNLLFSCCCARVDWSWTTVCGCYNGGWKCDHDCVQESLVEDSLFYTIGTVRSSSRSLSDMVTDARPEFV
jgi:lipase ATG15